MYMIASLLVLILMSDKSSMLIRSPIDSHLLCVYVAALFSKRSAGLEPKFIVHCSHACPRVFKLSFDSPSQADREVNLGVVSC